MAFFPSAHGSECQNHDYQLINDLHWTQQINSTLTDKFIEGIVSYISFVGFNNGVSLNVLWVFDK